MFYLATAQSMRLYDNETWNMSPAALAMMEGFHVHAARRMAGMMSRKRGDMWVYPKSREVLKAVGLHTVEHYIGTCCQTIARWIVHRPIFDLCKGEERRRRSAPR